MKVLKNSNTVTSKMARGKPARNSEGFVKIELAGCPEDVCCFAGVDVCIDNPIYRIIDTAERFKAAVIIMGKHSQAEFERLFLAVWRRRCRIKAGRPVFLVPLSID
ncbi:hypothetical protein [Geopsychrobacter electrodiphilus]|uniref:hypothetical protein n=1 Tax=Geopsychrobacter electrodiphilus TaxID=225196 RepID=UPI0005266AB2|nr:hypothetical protein [Geopsychrobacter electrodiphilus]